jgi:DNA-binding transcriptional MerR regulator
MYHQLMANSAPVPEVEGDDAEYTIDQLSNLTGMTARNIRAHQSRGLLPAPVVRGRTGYYGAEHVARLRLILQMQSEGFNLGSIARILEGVHPGTAAEVLDFNRALRHTWEEETPEIVDADELAARFPGDAPANTLRERSLRLGLLTALPDGRFEVRSPSLLRAGEALLELGVPIASLIAVEDDLLRHSRGVARSFVRLFLDEVWQPFDAAGRPDAEWPRIRAALDYMSPLAGDSLAAGFRLAMAREVDKAFGKMLQQQARRPRQ